MFIICSTSSSGKSQRILQFSTLKYPFSSVGIFVFKKPSTIKYSSWRVFNGKRVSRGGGISGASLSPHVELSPSHFILH